MTFRIFLIMSTVIFCSAQASLHDDEEHIKYHKKLETVIDSVQYNSLTKNVRYICGEMAAVNADKFLELSMVPRAIIVQQKNNKNEDTIAFCSQWIEHEKHVIPGSDDLKKLITQEEWENMNVFYFLFGQYDRHFGNLAIQKETNKLYLIDNEAIANVHQEVFEYSADKNLGLPWIAIKKLPPQDNTQTEPHNFLDVVNSTNYDVKKMLAEVENCDEWTQLDMINGNGRIWNNFLWRRFYYNASIAAPFSEKINSNLLKKIESLDEHNLSSFWPQLPFAVSESGQQQYQELINLFTSKTLERKAMILAYFHKNQSHIH